MRRDTLKSYRERILKVLVHVQQNLDAALPLDELARLACFSPYHFHRIFRGMVGESVKEHVRRLRLERAAGSLKHTALPVTTIAFDAGYETHESFTRAFKAMFGEAPSIFRRRSREVTAPAAPSGVHYVSADEPASLGFKEREATEMKVEIRKVEPIRVAFMRHVGPYMEVGATWEKLVPGMGARGMIGPDTKFIGVCHDDPEVTPPEKIRYDACVTVSEDFVPEGEVGVQLIPGGEYAVTTHHGPYQKLGETYAAFCGEWLPRSGRELRAQCGFEVYLNDPDGTEPEELLTDIYMPLEPA
ncbi:MAG: AraC family transcriptional regulator [Planctomycetota bacterium]|jgi:AraC family transcriptional regulator